MNKKLSNNTVANLKELNMKNFYMTNYPTDNVGSTLSAEPNFYNLLDGMQQGIDVYNIMGGNADSLVRERIFIKLSDTMGVDYDIIFNLWLDARKDTYVNEHVYIDGDVDVDNTCVCMDPDDLIIAAAPHNGGWVISENISVGGKILTQHLFKDMGMLDAHRAFRAKFNMSHDIFDTGMRNHMLQNNIDGHYLANMFKPCWNNIN